VGKQLFDEKSFSRSWELPKLRTTAIPTRGKSTFRHNVIFPFAGMAKITHNGNSREWENNFSMKNHFPVRGNCQNYEQQQFPRVGKQFYCQKVRFPCVGKL
jgi:hypothetical protein